MKKILAIGALIVLSGATFWYLRRDGGESESPFRFVEVERGDLEAVVSSTGALEPVTTVEVGTQVSGRIARLFVDFNDQVRRGQLVATIDTTLLVSAVKDAEATVERNLAQLRQAEREFERIKPLYEKQFVTDVEYNQAQYNLEIAQAQVKSARISLERTRQNLSYATIYAPIDGTVVERNVEVGQTVAASLSAPILFLIAKDLAEMQILASVDESDIGMIQEGQQARFTVQAYPDDVFMGTVRQVRLQSTMQENVVNYTVVVNVDNSDGRLLPGMTATVDFLIETARDVLKVSNAALRFRPPAAMMTAVRERRMQQREERMQNAPDSTRARLAGRDSARAARPTGDQATGGFGGGNGGGFGGGARNMAMLWTLDEDGQVTMVPVRTGISDGQATEIVPMRNAVLEPGTQIIAGVTQAYQEEVGEEESTSPFQSNQDSGRRRFGGF